MKKPEFQVTVDETGAVNISPGTLVAFNSGGTEVFTIGDNTVNTPFSVPLKVGSGTWMVTPEASTVYIPQGSYRKETPSSAYWQGPVFEDGMVSENWQLTYNGTTLTIQEDNFGYYLFNGAFSIPIVSRNYGTSTLLEQEYAYDSIAGTVETWLGVTDPTLAIDIDTATGIAILYNGTDTIAERTGDVATLEIIGQYVPTAYGTTTYGAGLEMVIVDYDYSPQTLAADSDAETNYNGGNPFNFAIQYFGGSLFNSFRYLIELLPNITGDPDGNNWPDNSTATIETGFMVPTDDSEWRLVTNRDWVLDPTGLGDGTQVVGEQATGLEDGLGGVMESTTYADTTYNGNAIFRFLVSSVPSVQNPGWFYLKITTDAIGDVTAFAGPFFGASLPSDTATETHTPLASIDLSGNVTSYT